MKLSTGERFWSKVKKTRYCWNWNSELSQKGYGVFKLNNKRIRAHRMSWILNFGEIPNNLFILHKCDNRKCVNPNHLFIGTIADNNRDMMKKGRWKRTAPAWNKGLKFANKQMVMI